MKRLVFVLSLISMFAGYLSSHPTSGLSLKTCIQRAQEFSFWLKSDQQKAEAAHRIYQYDYSQMLPQINGELYGEQRMLRPYTFGQYGLFVHSDWSLGKLFLKTAQASKQDELRLRAEIEQTRLDVSLRAALLYVNILHQQSQTNLLKKRLGLLKAHHRVAAALWQSGIRTQFDLMQTESKIEQLNEEIELLEIDRDGLLQELARLLNEKNINDLKIKSLDTEKICRQDIPVFMPELLQNIPMIQAITFRIKAQQLHTLTVKAEQLPHLHVAGGYMTDRDPTGDGNYWQVAVGITMPLFRWNAANYRRQESEALIQSMNFQKREIERNLSIYITQTRQKLARLKEVIQMQKKRFQTTEKAFQLAETNYRAGVMTNLEYLSAQQQLTETHITIRKTQLDYVMNMIKFYIITNQIDKIEWMEK